MRFTLLVITALIVTVSCGGLSPQSSSVSVTGDLRRWYPATLDFQGPESKEMAVTPNPFLDYRLQVAFTAPSGRVYVFYDYNTRDFHEIGGRTVRVDMLGDYAWKYSDDGGLTWSDRHRLPVVPNRGRARAEPAERIQSICCCPTRRPHRAALPVRSIARSHEPLDQDC